MRLEDIFQQIDALYSRCNFQELCGPLEELVQTCTAQLGPEDPIRIALANELGGYYRHSGQYEKSEQQFLYAKALCERILVPTDYNYATTLNNLAGTYRLMGRFQAAQQIFCRAADIYVKTVGKNSVLYASALNNLGVVFEQEGKARQSEEMHLQALAILEHLPLSKDERVLIGITYMNCAAALASQGKLDQAQQEYQKAERVFQAEGATRTGNYIALCNGMASVAYCRREYETAEEIYWKTLSICEEICGKDHADTAAVLINLGLVLAEQGKVKSALKCADRVLAIRSGLFAPDSKEIRDCQALIDRLK